MKSCHLFALAALFSTTSIALSEPALVITLPGIADRVRSQNPDLAAARFRIDEAIGRAKQSGRLSNPELETSFEHNSRFREGKIEVGFSQRFPVTNRLLLEKEISALQVKAAEAEVREVERRIVADAQQVVIRILSIRQQRELLDQQALLSKKLSEFLSESATQGETSPLDAGQAKLEAAAITVEARQLDAAEANAVGELKPLLGMTQGNALAVSGSLPLPEIPRVRIDPSARPDLEAARLDAAAAERGVELERAQRHEDIQGGVFAAAERGEDAPDGYENEAIVGFKFSIPLPLWNKNEGNIEAAQATQKRKHLEAVALDRSIRLQAESSRTEMREWAELLAELSDTLIPLSNEQVLAADKALREGQGDIQTLFRAREKQLQLSASRIEALREFHLARVRHNAALGKH